MLEDIFMVYPEVKIDRLPVPELLNSLRKEGKLGPPSTLGECATKGPCVHVGCRHNNYLEVDGPFVKLNFPDIEPQDMREPCSLRVAIRVGKRKPIGPGGEVTSHAEASAFIGLTAERTRQVEAETLKDIKQRRPDLR